MNYNLSNYQTLAVEKLYDFLKYKQDLIVIKAPTGSGKTVIMIDFISKIFYSENNLAVIWLTPGIGDLETQSKKSMNKLAPSIKTKDIDSAISEGFKEKEVVFINWELITKKGNKAISESERKNFLDQLKVSHKSNLKFILIVDEEHSNDTAKANDIINLIKPIKQIRLSATAKKRNNYDFYEIHEKQVISEGFITKAIFINQDINQNDDLSNEAEFLVNTAIKKRSEIYEEYIKLNKKINPLIIIQVPNNSQQLIKNIEDYLQEKHNTTYKNLKLAKWLSDEKINLQNLERNESFQEVLIMKQAISTGWDCLRAKVLVKLRENMSESFEIQTIGRIRRMPERIHYNNELLDFCFLYTFDKKYIEGVKETTSFLLSSKKLFLKNNMELREFYLKKEIKSNDLVTIDHNEVIKAIIDYYFKEYSLSGVVNNNKNKLEINGYLFKDKIENRIVVGKYNSIEEVKDKRKEITIDFVVDTHKFGIDLLHVITEISKILKINYFDTKIIINRLFSNETRNDRKILNLSKKEFYSFFINNQKRIYEDFKKILSQLSSQLNFKLDHLEKKFTFPKEHIAIYDSEAKFKNVLSKNVYSSYDEQILTDGVRTKSERLFEKYCEFSSQVDWIYKNGDSGSQYFSIVYYDYLGNQNLFYPDYIVKTFDNKIWIIETKGGEYAGVDKNIDLNAKNKFEALKNYTINNKVYFGFVRDLDDDLLINYENYEDSLKDKSWVPLKEIF